jgi:hypothetical protein
MLRSMALMVGGLAAATIALAAGDIPTRYTGSFPSTGRNTSITGAFSGSALTLKYLFKKGPELVPVTGSYSCDAAPPNRSRCSGSFKTPNGRGQGNVVITWSNGKPVAMQMSGRM